jgi:hypothetical protein
MAGGVRMARGASTDARSASQTMTRRAYGSTRSAATMMAGPLSEKEVTKAVQTVKRKLNSNAQVKKELGQLEQVVKVLGSGQQGSATAVRFQARFRRGGMGRVAVPLPFMLGQSNERDGRGSGYACVAAKVEGGKVISCFLEKDGGYGSRINVV